MYPRPFHNHIVYVDESGDHGSVSKEYPVFVLTFCIFDKESYAADFATEVQRLKFKYFGHDVVHLHEREIRKAEKPFHILRDARVRDAFMGDINTLVDGAKFTLIASVIRKDTLRRNYGLRVNPYHLAMQFGMERVAHHLHLRASSPSLHIVCEQRGRTEDSDLKLEFRRICADNILHFNLPMEIVFAPKGNYCGLELADLVARPIGRHILNPTQTNRAYEVIKKKLRRSPRGQIEGWGLKCFP